MKILNNPAKSMRRYELLRTLFEVGINDFNIYRPTECRIPARFPVLFHSESKHNGCTVKLIYTPEELYKELEIYLSTGNNREDTLIEEFCNTADERGLYRKYSAFRVGNSIIPHHLIFGKDWMLKSHDRSLGPLFLNEENDYLLQNLHENELRIIFDLAQIEYGRIDYAIKDGRIQVWEINTNPMLNKVSPTSLRYDMRKRRAEKMHIALHAINISPHSSSVIKNPVGNGIFVYFLRFCFNLLPINLKWKIRSFLIKNKYSKMIYSFKRSALLIL